MSVTRCALVLLAVLVLSASCYAKSIHPGSETPIPAPAPIPAIPCNVTSACPEGCDETAESTCWKTFETCSNTDPRNASHVCSCLATAFQCTYSAGCWDNAARDSCLDFINSGSFQDCPVSICDPTGAATPTITATPPPGCLPTANECSENYANCVNAAGNDYKSLCECINAFSNCLYAQGCWVGVDVDQCEKGMTSLQCHQYGLDPCQPGSTTTPSPSPTNCKGPKITACQGTYAECAIKADTNTSAVCECLSAMSVCIEVAGCYNPDYTAACEAAASQNSCGAVCLVPPTPTPTSSPEVCEPNEAELASDELRKCATEAGRDRVKVCFCTQTYTTNMTDIHCWNDRLAQSCQNGMGKACTKLTPGVDVCNVGNSNKPTLTAPFPPTELYDKVKALMFGASKKDKSQDDVGKVRAKLD